MVISGELNSSSDSQRVVVGQVKPATSKVSSAAPIPSKFKVPAPVQMMNPEKRSREKSIKPISGARFKANQSWIEKMQDTAQWEWDHLYMEWDLRDLLNIPKLSRLDY